MPNVEVVFEVVGFEMLMATTTVEHNYPYCLSVHAARSSPIGNASLACLSLLEWLGTLEVKRQWVDCRVNWIALVQKAASELSDF